MCGGVGFSSRLNVTVVFRSQPCLHDCGAHAPSGRQTLCAAPTSPPMLLCPRLPGACNARALGSWRSQSPPCARSAIQFSNVRPRSSAAPIYLLQRRVPGHGCPRTCVSWSSTSAPHLYIPSRLSQNAANQEPSALLRLAAFADPWPVFPYVGLARAVLDRAHPRQRCPLLHPRHPGGLLCDAHRHGPHPFIPPSSRLALTLLSPASSFPLHEPSSLPLSGPHFARHGFQHGPAHPAPRPRSQLRPLCSRWAPQWGHPSFDVDGQRQLV